MAKHCREIAVALPWPPLASRGAPPRVPPPPPAWPPRKGIWMHIGERWIDDHTRCKCGHAHGIYIWVSTRHLSVSHVRAHAGVHVSPRGAGSQPGCRGRPLGARPQRIAGAGRASHVWERRCRGSKVQGGRATCYGEAARVHGARTELATGSRIGLQSVWLVKRGWRQGGARAGRLPGAVAEAWLFFAGVC